MTEIIDKLVLLENISRQEIYKQEPSQFLLQGPWLSQEGCSVSLQTKWKKGAGSFEKHDYIQF